MTRSAGSASSLKVNAWLSRGKWNPSLVLDPLEDFASGKSQIFTELEMRDTFDSATPCSLVHPGARDAQECGNLFDRSQFTLGDTIGIATGALGIFEDHGQGKTSSLMCLIGPHN
jgi:hypothetical protein